MTSRKQVVFPAAILVAASFTGCLGWLFGEDGPAQSAGNQGLGALGNATLEELAGRASGVPRNYTFPGQAKLPPAVAYFNWSVGPEANAAFEDRNDRAGNRFGTILYTADVSQFIPSGQPTEIALTGYSAPQPGSSADLDIYVNVPGTRTDYAGDNGDEFNWKWQVQRMTVNTIGVAGEKHEVGLQIANGKIASPMTITLRAEFSYEADVVTPHVPWAFDVPKNASGIVLESAKAGGQQNVQAKFAVIGPNDDLVAFVDYNDIAIPTESVYIATTAGPGEYIVYVFEMQGGFLRLFADVGVPNREVRALALDVREEMVAASPAPGMIDRDWGRGTALEGVATTPAQPGGTASIQAATFPLKVTPIVKGTGPTAGTQVTVTSAKGMVAQYTRFGRVDLDQGSLGVTSEFWNTMFHPENLAKGELTVSFTNNSPTLTAGYVLVTYKRA